MGFYETRRLLTEVAAAKLDDAARLSEPRSRYQAAEEPMAVHLRWQDLAGATRIANLPELEQVLGHLCTLIAAELEQQRVVLVE